MSQIISPGVYTKENDLSYYISNLSSTLVAMVGTSEKGPSNTPILITSASQFSSIFGDQDPRHYLGYAVKAYLNQGSSVYVTRVAPVDAKIAKVTMLLPETYTPYGGAWTLASATASEATFIVTDYASLAASSPNKTIKLDTGTVIPGFVYNDTAVPQTVTAVGKLGADLTSFVAAPEYVTKYVKGGTFSITSGAGKNSVVTITDLVEDSTDLKVKVNASSFNAFNSPLKETATSVLTLGSTFVLPTAGATLFSLGATSHTPVGNVLVTYDAVATATAVAATFAGSDEAAKKLALESIVSLSTNDIKIAVPLYSVSASNNVLSLNLINAIISGLISILQGTVEPVIGTFPNLNALWHNARAVTASGIIGLGSVAIDGTSKGIKSCTAVKDTNNVTTSLVFSALTLGATSAYTSVTPATGLTITPMVITGEFVTNLYRPTWNMTTAGLLQIPTYLKFTSIGEGDFSNIAVTVSLNVDLLDAEKNKLYTVRVFTKQTSSNIDPNSTLINNFVVSEEYSGTPEVIQNNINLNSNLVRLQLDYSTTNLIDLETGEVTTEDFVSSDNLFFEPILVTDITNKGVLFGSNYELSGRSYLPALRIFLTGGSAGSAVTRDDIIGTSENKTGIYNYSDPEQLDLNLLVVPGWSADPAVAKAMVELCENRSDCMCIIDTPFGLSVQNAVSYRKNILGINNNYGAMYYPWVKITDSVNKKDVYVPPSGLVAAQYAYSDYVGDVFSAPAGRNRGNITSAVGTERVLNQGDRDQLALNQINPIVNETGYGIYIRGQMTLQTATTALDRVNVRRLLLKLRKVVATASKYFEFEPGDNITAMRLKGLAETLLEEHKNKGAIRSYTVDVGPNVNTALSLENNELRMSISIVPVKTGEKIVEIFNILPQGAGISISS